MPQANYGFRVLEHEQIPLNDGTLLSARVWLPDETFNTPVPAILEYLPYRKRGGTEERDEITHPHFANTDTPASVWIFAAMANPMG